jgi:hypothetical protein
MVKFEVPDGWCVQAFGFTLDPTEDQVRVEPTVRPGLARPVAVKRGRAAAAGLPNNPEMGVRVA